MKPEYKKNLLQRIKYDCCPLCNSQNLSTDYQADCSKHPLYIEEIPSTMQWINCNECGHQFVDGYFSNESLSVIFSKTNENQKVGYQIEQQRAISSKIIEKVLSYQLEGNWLDRDLSATERQHVGLALIYALRRASTEWALPLPVIIDTPTSRMDSEHKSWSVTRFYPQLSQQVVVLATSDDLAGGLFEELEESGVLGSQILVREVSENSVEAISSNLSTFFGGRLDE